MLHSLTVACVNAGNYEGRGVDYVNRLLRAVKRNSTVPFSFVCFTDEEDTAYSKRIILKPIPMQLKGWWNKMYMFKAGVLEGRVVYLDLDTVITGNIDALLKLETPFAMLRDVMRPHLKASGVMAWLANGRYGLWDAYEDAGRPHHWKEGDGGFIADHLAYEPDLLQNHVDGIYSYKKNCRAQGLPDDATIVCFHGQPRPHMVADAWVGEHWK